MQGRSLYGGVQAVLAVRAMQTLSDNLPIRTLQATLCAPVPAGIVRIRVRRLRKGGNTRQIEARIVDGEDTVAIFVAVFGRSRDSAVAQELAAPALSQTDGLAMRHIPSLTPDFIRQFDARLLVGNFPGSGQADTSQAYRLTLHDAAGAASLAHVLVFADFPPPVGLSWLHQPRPASTMTWMLNFTGHDYADQTLENWLIDVSLDAARDGYTQQTVTLFAPDGLAVARGTQCMVVFG